MLVVDRLGRRPLLLTGVSGMVSPADVFIFIFPYDLEIFRGSI